MSNILAFTLISDGHEQAGWCIMPGGCSGAVVLSQTHHQLVVSRRRLHGVKVPANYKKIFHLLWEEIHESGSCAVEAPFVEYCQ